MTYDRENERQGRKHQRSWARSPQPDLHLKSPSCWAHHGAGHAGQDCFRENRASLQIHTETSLGSELKEWSDSLPFFPGQSHMLVCGTLQDPCMNNVLQTYPHSLHRPDPQCHLLDAGSVGNGNFKEVQFFKRWPAKKVRNEFQVPIPEFYKQWLQPVGNLLLIVF